MANFRPNTAVKMTQSPKFDAGRPNLSRALGRSIQEKQIAAETGFEVLENVFDSKSWFADPIWIAR